MRPWNFSAGPSALPLSVLEQAAAEMTNWHGSGMSVMEMSHRGKQFMQIHAEARDDLRELLSIPDNFRILFMQGGATAENAIVPMNLIGRSAPASADYVLSGIWSSKSFKEAGRYGDVAVAGSSEQSLSAPQGNFSPWTWFPDPQSWVLRPEASYVHICTNETIGGVEFADWQALARLPNPDVPLVLDMSSHFLSRPVDFSRVGLVYAGAQKNAGPAGVTMVIIRDDLLDHALSICPSAFNYGEVARADSMLNTPPTYPIYIAGLVFKWLKQQGGVKALEALNEEKADLLYGYLDRSSLYESRVHPAARSRMNVPFFLRNESLNSLFLQEAEAAGLMQLKGHKSVGGMRASIYNAVPLQAVQALISFMQAFEQRHG